MNDKKNAHVIWHHNEDKNENVKDTQSRQDWLSNWFSLILLCIKVHNSLVLEKVLSV
jgi:hypothetical protein